jgi:hypothetical protein
MAHDPCAECGDPTGPSSDNREILIDGDVPALTFCSYGCLRQWAERQMD